MSPYCDSSCNKSGDSQKKVFRKFVCSSLLILGAVCFVIGTILFLAFGAEAIGNGMMDTLPLLAKIGECLMVFGVFNFFFGLVVTVIISP